MLKQHGPVADNLVNNLLIVIAYCNQLQSSIVNQSELTLEALANLAEQYLVVVHTKREAQSRILHQVDAYVQFSQYSKNRLQIILGNKREVFRLYGDKQLVVSKNVQGYKWLDAAIGTYD